LLVAKLPFGGNSLAAWPNPAAGFRLSRIGQACQSWQGGQTALSFAHAESGIIGGQATLARHMAT